MRYALNLAEDKHILSAWEVLPKGNYYGMPIVGTFPENVVTGEESITNYLYINSEYVYAPKPKESEPEADPTVWDELDAAYQEGVDSVV